MIPVGHRVEGELLAADADRSGKEPRLFDVASGEKFLQRAHLVEIPDVGRRCEGEVERSGRAPSVSDQSVEHLRGGNTHHAAFEVVGQLAPWFDDPHRQMRSARAGRRSESIAYGAMGDHRSVRQADDHDFTELGEIMMPAADMEPEAHARLRIEPGEAEILAPIVDFGKGALPGRFL